MFEGKRLERQIQAKGQDYTFNRYGLNVYKERTKDSIKTINIKGLYHNQISYVDIVGTDAVRKQRTFTPMILVTYVSFQKDPLEIDDEVLVNGIKHKVTGTTNIQEANYGIDISLVVI